MAAENRLKIQDKKVQHTRFYLSIYTESVLSNKKLGLCGGGGGGALFIWRAP
jgi:hypothetical protein